jgi:hypothetical protein
MGYQLLDLLVVSDLLLLMVGERNFQPKKNSLVVLLSGLILFLLFYFILFYFILFQ